MRFVDECQLRAEAGKGGNGCIAFRREKFVPLGGPAGGDGGRGGDVVFIGDGGMSTLSDLTHQKFLRAEPGENGSGRDRYGKGGRDLEVRVPLGTIVLDRATGQKLGEVTIAGQRFVVAKGGVGGKGNRHFATPIDRAPRKAEDGQGGERRDLRLELKVMADVGLLGLPNVGKSTFITTVSRARSKVADYPFTTLHPHLGVVRVGDWGSGLGNEFVIADIPGLVPGAADGQGLGSRFLRHVQRTRLLVHLLSLGIDGDGDPVQDYVSLRDELRRFDSELAARPELVVLSKQDLPDVREAHPELQQRFRDQFGRELHLISSATRFGVAELLRRIATELDALKAESSSPEP